MKTLAVLHAVQLATLAGPARPRVGRELSQTGIVRDGGLLVRDGIIVATGPSDSIARQLSSEDEVVDAGGQIVLPGFVDAHAHPVFAGDRLDEFELRARGATYEEIAAGDGGIRLTVRKTRAASEEQLEEKALWRAHQFLRGGTTTLEAKSGYGLSVADELKILRAIRATNEKSSLELVPTFLGAHAFPDEWKAEPERYVDLVIEEMLPAVAREGLAEFCDIFCESGYFSAAAARKILGRARALGLGLRLHVDQLTAEGGAELAAELGSQTADHLEQTETNGIRALAAAGVQPILLPGSVYALSKNRYPRAREMIEEGLAVVLATDFNPGSSPTTSMAMVQSLAVTQMKMLPAEALVAATINGAYSLNRGASVGSLEPGKRANFMICDCDDYREISYYFGMNLVRSVYVDGQCVVSG